MAILNFPDNPQTDDQYTGDNGTTYIFDGVKWVGHAAGGAAGTNSIQNGSYTVQVDNTGALVLPGGQTLSTNTWTGNITSVTLGVETVVRFDVAPFGYGETGQVVIAGVNTPSELNGTWYYQAWEPGAVKLFTSETVENYVVSSEWSAWTTGGTVTLVSEFGLTVNGNTWKFSQDGSTALPFGKQLSFDENQFAYIQAMPNQGPSILKLHNGGDVLIEVANTDIQADQDWTFDINGNLVPPGQTLANYQGSSYTSPTLKLGVNTTDVTIADAVNDSNNRGSRWIRIQGQQGFGAIEGGPGGRGTSVGIHGGLGGESSEANQGGEGGNIEIRSGNGQHGNGGGYVNIQGGDATWSNAGGGLANNVSGGPVWISGGGATSSLELGTGFGGDVNIQGGVGNAQNGKVQVQTYSGSQWNYWNFKPAGVLEMPGISGSGYTLNAAQTTSISAGSAPTVVFNSVSPYVESIKAIVKVNAQQADIGGDYDIDTQLCEMLITKKMRFIDNGGLWINTAVATVYGVTHTSDTPLATFTVNLLPNTGVPGSRDIIQILAEPTAAVTGTNMWVQVVATELIND